jgi:hypothetical protein
MVVRSASCASTSVPIARPAAVRNADASALARMVRIAETMTSNAAVPDPVK